MKVQRLTLETNMKNFLIKRAIKFRYKQDCHPKKGYINWWEDLGYYKSKSAKRLQLKRDLLLEYNSDTSAHNLRNL